MEEKRILLLIMRQIDDIQMQADKILHGEDTSVNIEMIARYSMELKDFINKKIKKEEILDMLKDIPDINYSREHTSILGYLWNQFVVFLGCLFNLSFASLFEHYYAKKTALDKIAIMKNKYASLEFILKAELNSMQ